MLVNLISVILLFILALASASLIASVPTWFLWNWLVPELFGLPEISWLNAFGLVLMINIVLRTKVKFTMRQSE